MPRSVKSLRRPAIAEQLAAMGAEFHSRGWALGTSGNYSTVLRREPLRLLITSSGLDKSALSRKDFLEIDQRSTVLKGKGQPSAETFLHLAVVAARRAGCVLHTHSVWSTLLSERYQPQGGLAISGYEMLKGLELWLKVPNAALLGNISACIPKIDFTGPAGWCGQAALWIGMPALAAAAIAGAIMLCAGLKVGVAMPPIPKPKIAIPPLGLLTPEIMLQFPLPPVPPLPVLEQPKLMKILLPFIDIGKLVACGKVSCC